MVGTLDRRHALRKADLSRRRRRGYPYRGAGSRNTTIVAAAGENDAEVGGAGVSGAESAGVACGAAPSHSVEGFAGLRAHRFYCFSARKMRKAYSGAIYGP